MSSAASPPPLSYSSLGSPCAYPPHLDMDTDALIATTLRVLEQRAAPTLHEILGAYTAKGDGDREMLFALLNAKTAEDNRMAADRNLRRTLIEACRTPSVPSSSAYAAQHPDMHSYPLPSPPTSLYQHSPAMMTQSPPPMSSRRRTSSSSSRSSEDDSNSPHLRKRRRSRSPGRRDYPPARTPYGTYASHRDSQAFPPSPQSSSSQTSSGSPRSRESMAIGSLLSSRGRDFHESDRRGSPSQ